MTTMSDELDFDAERFLSYVENLPVHHARTRRDTVTNDDQGRRSEVDGAAQTAD